MKKTQDTSLIIASIILISFGITTALYFLSNNSFKKNNSENLNIPQDIYKEHTHTIAEETTPNIKKEYKEIATYTTNIYDKDNNRIYNIKKACKALDGKVIKPNEEFSFNNTMGNMSEADGYKKALGFDSKGNKIKVSGGGICQISSTLYNSVLIAKLKVTERHAHSRRVYYVPKNKDATVFSGGPDLKFINTTSSNIMICTSTDGYTVTVSLKQETTLKI